MPLRLVYNCMLVKIRFTVDDSIGIVHFKWFLIQFTLVFGDIRCLYLGSVVVSRSD